MKKRFIAVLLAVLTLLPGGALAAGRAFSDVDDSYGWARDAIEGFAAQGIVDGVGGGRFAPDDPVTREEFAKMLTLSFGMEPAAGGVPAYADVAADRWSYGYVEAARGYLDGYADPSGGNMTFKPETPARREDIAAAIVRILGYRAEDSDAATEAEGFTDYGAISPALRPYVGVAAARGLIEGYADGTFRPQAGITRAEAAVMLYRAVTQAADAQPEADAPKLTVTVCPSSVTEAEVTVSGAVSGQAGTLPSVTVNDKAVSVSPSGKFSVRLTLAPGDNEVVFTARDAAGKAVTETRMIKYTKSKGSLAEGYGYVQSTYRTKDGDGDTAVVIEVWDGSQARELWVKDADIGTEPRQGDIAHYYVYGDGTLDRIGRVANGKLGAVKEWDVDTGRIRLFDGTTYRVTNDTFVLYVDTGRHVGADGGAVSEAFADGGGHYNNVFLATEVGEDVGLRVLVVDVNNQWED